MWVPSVEALGLPVRRCAELRWRKWTEVLKVAFLHPWMLGALASMAIPFLLMQLNKKPRRAIPWAAMRLVQAVLPRSRRLNTERWLVILMRCLALAALVLAFSRPLVRG